MRPSAGFSRPHRFLPSSMNLWSWAFPRVTVSMFYMVRKASRSTREEPPTSEPGSSPTL